MDYKAEQEMEVEALQAILMEELEGATAAAHRTPPVTHTNTELESRQVPAQWDVDSTCWRVAIVPMEDGEPVVSDDPKRMELVFAHTAQYPEAPPLYKVRNLRGVSDVELEACMAMLEQVVQENLGMAMIYNLVTAAQDWLRDVVCVDGGDTVGASSAATSAASQMGAGVEQELSAEEQQRKAMEEEERRMAELRRLGTPVTPESFESWRITFEAEVALQETSVVGAEGKGRLTGKQWFLQQEKAGVQVSEVPTDDDEETFEEEQRRAEEARRLREEEEEEDFDPDEEDEDEDDDEMLDEMLAGRG